MYKYKLNGKFHIRMYRDDLAMFHISGRGIYRLIVSLKKHDLEAILNFLKMRNLVSISNSICYTINGHFFITSIVEIVETEECIKIKEDEHNLDAFEVISCEN